MFLPDQVLSIVFVILSVIFWGCWVNTLKISHIRSELFLYDFSIGAFVTVLVVAFTMGGGLMGVSDGVGSGKNFPSCLGSLDNLSVVLALIAGCACNVSLLLVVSSLDNVGMAVAFPLVMGIAFVLGTLVELITSVTYKDDGFLFSGLGLIIVAVICIAFALKYRKSEDSEPISFQDPIIKEDPSSKPKSSLKGVALCVLSGVFLAAWKPLLSQSISDPSGLSIYTSFFFHNLSILITTIPLCYISSKRNALPISDYFKGAWHSHLLSCIAGILWTMGSILNFLASKQLDTAYVIGNSAPLVTALWGLLVWREFFRPRWTVLLLLLMVFGFYGAGLALVSQSV